jgi:hypothetical protein
MLNEPVFYSFILEFKFYSEISNTRINKIDSCIEIFSNIIIIYMVEENDGTKHKSIQRYSFR